MTNSYKQLSLKPQINPVAEEALGLLEQIKNAGEIKQKELRSQNNYSDSKVSQLLDVLHRKHLIRKTKVGRDNYLQVRI